MTIKVVELVGESQTSWQDAVEKAVRDASKTIDNIVGVEVINNTANVKDGKLFDYRANVNIAFKVNGTE
jgi:flavin-binding protein dodecin